MSEQERREMMRGMSKIGATLGGLSIAVLVGAACVPPTQPPPPGGTTSPPTTSKPLPNTPDGETFLAGKPAPGKVYDGDASRVQISGDGNWVVYHHGSVNLDVVNRPPSSCPKPPRTNTQIYRTNLLTGRTELVTIGVDGCYANGESSFPDTNSNGRYVAYVSRATNLAKPDGNGGQQDVFLKDMLTGTTKIVSVASNGAPGNGSSNRPDLTDDGSVIAFNSDASNLVPGDTNGDGDCFITRRDIPTQVQRASLSDTEAQLNSFSYRCQLTGNASAMVFSSHATNAVAGSMSSGQRIYVRDFGAGRTTLISRRANGAPAQASRPDISSDGRCVTFQSSDSGIVAPDSDVNEDAFLFDRTTGKMRNVSVARDGSQVDGASTRIVVNANCTIVAFVSNSNKLVPEDRNGTRDTFMRDLRSNSLSIVSVNSAEQQAHKCSNTPTTTTTTVPGVHDPTGAEDISTRPSLSDDGLVVAYISDVCGLVPEEPLMAGYDGVIVRWLR